MKKITIYPLIIFCLAIAGAGFLSSASVAYGASTNLILNGNLQIGSPGSPTNWQLGGYNDTFVGTYPVAGPLAGDKAAKIDVSLHNNGDAKWIFNDVSVLSGALYTFSDSYNSTATTSLVVAFTPTSGTSTLFTTISTLPPTNGTWRTSAATFTVPLGYSLASVYHVIAAVGSLTTTNYNLSLAAVATDNLFSQGMVSLSFDDGWSTQYDNALPILNNKNLKGTFFIVSKDMTDANSATADNLLSSTMHPDVITSNTISSITWSNVYTDPTNKTYRFTDNYFSHQTSTVELTYRLNNGLPTTMILGTLPATAVNFGHASFLFTLPGNPTDTVTPIEVTHKTSFGSITVTNPALTNYDLYMNSNQLLELQAGGNEIANHTVNHCDLVTGLCPDAIIHNSPDSLTAAQEIGNAKTTLLSYIPSSSNSFAYPYGSFNADTQNIVKTDGISAARSIISGYNTKYSDKLALNTQVVDSTTPLSRVYAWIDNAINNKWWLILTFHQIEDQSAIIANGDTGAVTPATFASIANYLNASQVKTINEGQALMLQPPTTYTINATAGANGTINPPGLSTINSGLSLTLAIVPDPGYIIDTLTVDGATTTATSTFTFSNVVANHTIDVTFRAVQPNSFTIYASAGANGLITPNATSTIVSGGNQTYTITPNSGYVINSLLIDGVPITATTTYSFVNIIANHTIVVTFGLIPPTVYTINATAGANGSISPSATTTVTSGGEQVYLITANSGYQIDTLTVDGASTTATSTYTFKNVISNHSISVTFKVVVVPPEPSGSSGGSSSSGDGTHQEYYGPGYREAINVPLVVSPDQSGRAIFDLGNGRHLSVYVPLNSVSENVQISITPIRIFNTNRMIKDFPSGVVLIDNMVYRITATNRLGQPVETFNANLEMSLDLDTTHDLSGAAMYYDDSVNNRWIMVTGGVLKDNKLSVSVNHLSTFSVIKSGYARVINYTAPEPLVLNTAVRPKVYSDGTLLRIPNMKIYAVVKGKKVYIANLKQLAKYRGTKITEISFEDLQNIK